MPGSYSLMIVVKRKVTLCWPCCYYCCQEPLASQFSANAHCNVRRPGCTLNMSTAWCEENAHQEELFAGPVNLTEWWGQIGRAQASYAWGDQEFGSWSSQTSDL